MTLFWHSHFATSNRKVGSVALMLQQNETLRRHALGGFGALLGEMTRDPAMLIWLDGAGSKKTKPNENLAASFSSSSPWESVTTRGGHTPAARALAGWVRVTDERFRGVDDFRIEPGEVDDGAKTFFKQTGPGRPPTSFGLPSINLPAPNSYAASCIAFS